MSKIHVIWNPVAGNGAARLVFEQVQARLTELGEDFSEAKSEYPGHAVELAALAVKEKHGLVLAIGGDGTVREVASALINTPIPLGIIPAGTGNDLVRSLGIPNKEPLRALDIALHGATRRMDAAKANELIYFNVAGFGFDVDVLQHVEVYKKTTKNGSLAYIKGLIAAIKDLTHRKTTVMTAEGTIVKNVMILACGNGTHFGGGMCVTPQADPFDGKLDVCIAHDVKKYELPVLLPMFIFGKHLRLKKRITYFKTAKLTACCEPAALLDVDGEIVPGTPVVFEILPAAVSIRVQKTNLLEAAKV